jgi:hypothetical protein
VECENQGGADATKPRVTAVSADLVGIEEGVCAEQGSQINIGVGPDRCQDKADTITSRFNMRAYRHGLLSDANVRMADGERKSKRMCATTCGVRRNGCCGDQPEVKGHVKRTRDRGRPPDLVGALKVDVKQNRNPGMDRTYRALALMLEIDAHVRATKRHATAAAVLLTGLNGSR